jgi:WD40 repeat protein
MITAIRISADQQKLFLGDNGGNLKLMSLTDATAIIHFGQLHNQKITGIVITEDEKFLFTSSQNGELKQWNYQDTTLINDYAGFTHSIHSLCL